MIRTALQTTTPEPDLREIVDRESPAKRELSMRCGAALTASLVLLLAFGVPAVAQRSPTPNPGESKAKTLAKPKPATKVETKQEAKPAPQPTPSVVMPDAEKIVLLLRTSLRNVTFVCQSSRVRHDCVDLGRN